MSDATRIKQSVFTVEGNLAGTHAAALERARIKLVADSEAQRVELRKRTESIIAGNKLRGFNARFKTQTQENVADSGLYGLKTREEWNSAQEGMRKRNKLAQISIDGKKSEGSGDESEPNKKKKSSKNKQKHQKRIRALLSFELDEKVTEDNAPLSNDEKNTIVIKNPSIDTSFLPDRDRDEAERRRVEELKKQWILQQEKMKEEKLLITYSYWDGNGHRREVEVTKGTTIDQFLEIVRKDVVKDFPHLRSATSETLMYVKEDFIIPHDATFYDMISSQARGKSGPLFTFDVHDDVRLVGDVRVQTDHSHAGKVLERHWYERNRHIYPASNWALLDLPALYSDVARRMATEDTTTKEFH